MNLDINDLPEEVTMTVYLHIRQNRYGWTHISEYSKGTDEYIVISEPTKVSFKIKPREDTVKAAVEALREQIQKVRATAEVECNQLEGRIQNLLALPNKSEES